MGFIAQNTDSNIWPVVAVVVGVVLGVTLQIVGALVNDRLAGRREDRRSEREVEERNARWDREDKIREEERQQEEQRAKLEARMSAYQGFVSAALLPGTGEVPLRQQRQALYEAYVEVQLLGSDYVLGEAEELYEAANAVLSEPNFDPESYPEHGKLEERLENARSAFLRVIADEADHES